MLSIRRIRKGDSRYEVIDIRDSNHTKIAVIDGLKAAACVLRFLKGSHLQPMEYQLAINVMEEIDSRERMDDDAGSG